MSSRLRSRLRASTSLSGGGGGPTAALDLNFVTGSYQFSGASYALQDIMRFSRTSAGTFYGSNGLVQNSPISNNLLLWTEEADNAAWTKTAVAVQSNLLTYSEQFDNAVWTKNNATVTANTITSPDGVTTADKVVETAVSGRHGVNQSISSSALVYTASVYAKRGENDFLAFAPGGSGQPNTFTWFNLATGAIGTNNNTSASMLDVGNGWYRCSITFTAIAGTLTTLIEMSKANGSNIYLGDGTSGIYVWGAQLVQGALPANYQPTLASAVAIQHLAPNNVLSANKIIEDSANTFHFVREAVTAANVAHTFTTYLKAGERTRVIVSMTDITTGDASIGVDLTNGTTFTATGLNIGSWTAISSSVTSVGNGWYRVRVTGTKGAGTQIAGSVFPTNGTSATFLGDGSSGFYMWGSQLEVGSSATAYTRNADGLFAPRIDYDPSTLAVKGLLIEEQRTNLIPYSEQFDDASWTKFQASITANASTSPDGTTTADKLVENSVSAVHEVKRNFTTVASTTYTMSVYLKADGRNWVFINFFNVGVADFRTFFNLSNGTVGTNPAGSTATITPVGNGWYRCAVTRTTAVGQTSTGINIGLADADNSPSYLGNGTSGVLVWGAQAELGSFTTAYIPTVASTVTRSADITTILLAAMSGLYNTAAGTLVIDVTPQLSNAANQFIGSLSDGSATNRASIFKTTAGIGGFRVTSGGTAANPTAPTNALTGNVTHKVALALTTGTGNVMPAVNGTLGTAATLSTMPTGISVIRLGVNEAANADWLNGHIRRIRYFNTRLSDAQLQTVTT